MNELRPIPALPAAVPLVVLLVGASLFVWAFVGLYVPGTDDTRISSSSTDAVLVCRAPVGGDDEPVARAEVDGEVTRLPSEYDSENEITTTQDEADQRCDELRVRALGRSVERGLAGLVFLGWGFWLAGKRRRQVERYDAALAAGADPEA